jgi:hypothetical protein
MLRRRNVNETTSMQRRPEKKERKERKERRREKERSSLIRYRIGSELEKREWWRLQR